MKRLIYIVLLFSLCGFLTSCKGKTNESRSSISLDNHNKLQPAAAAGYDEEFTYYGISKIESSSDTNAGWSQNGQKLLLTGIVYQSDGKTPAPGVLIYYYHTNTEGKYLHKPEEKKSMPPNELGQTHGYIRGWVKTDSSGKYYIYTVKPGVYPTHDEPAHIHATIKEPNGIMEYYIDDFVFDDDKLLTSAKRKKMENRCGSGVLRMVERGELQIGERNLLLGLNIPGYPVKNTVTINSGRNIGEDVFSFMPYHAWGPDKGTRTCPVCKYGWYEGILYFVGNNPNWAEIRQWLVLWKRKVRKGKSI
jgi:protocatechuate 3,4-dioxygenase beta subunit